MYSDLQVGPPPPGPVNLNFLLKLPRALISECCAAFYGRPSSKDRTEQKQYNIHII